MLAETAKFVDIVAGYLRRGWAPLPVPFAQKRPTHVGWPKLRIGLDDVEGYFGGTPRNVGVLLGEPSGGLVDVDLDCSEAVLLAPHFLPATGAIFGRMSKRGSHWLYVISAGRACGKSTLRFCAPSTVGPTATLLELRVGGASAAQTIFPPSTHPSGEIVEWDSDGDPHEVDADLLVTSCGRLAAVVLLGRHWGDPGARNEYRMAMCGLLIRAMWSDEDVANFVDAVTVAAGGVSDRHERLSQARSTRERLASGETLYGFPKLAELVGRDVAYQAIEWLGIAAFCGDEITPSSIELSEDGVAHAFSARFATSAKFDHELGTWFTWAEDHWSRDATGYVPDRIRDLIREVTAGETGVRTRAFRNVRFARGVEWFARNGPLHGVQSDLWDRDAWLLGAPGMTIDLRTGHVRHPSPEDYITKRVAVLPADSEECPRFLRFLDEATEGDAAFVSFLQRWFGYALTGDTREQQLLFIEGPTGTGKSALLDTISLIMGDYADVADVGTFTASKFEAHPAGVAKLRGARLIVASETEVGQHWAESKIKRLTGEELVPARFMAANWFKFRPVGKITIAGNHRPGLVDAGGAMRRRLVLAPFVRRPAVLDRGLRAALYEEAYGILRWLITGCLEWQARGLEVPAALQEAADEYFLDQDELGAWLRSDCDLRPGDRHVSEASADLWARWQSYALLQGVEFGSRRHFSERLRERGLRAYSNGSERRYRGVRLKSFYARSPADAD